FVDLAVLLGFLALLSVGDCACDSASIAFSLGDLTIGESWKVTTGRMMLGYGPRPETVARASLATPYRKAVPSVLASVSTFSLGIPLLMRKNPISEILNVYG